MLRQLQALGGDAQAAILRSLDKEILQRALAEVNAPSDKRKSQRRRVLRTAKAIYNNKSCVIDCQVRDISDGGCRIRVGSSTSLPRLFAIAIQGADRVRECEALWRTATEVGVQFLT